MPELGKTGETVLMLIIFAFAIGALILSIFSFSKCAKCEKFEGKGDCQGTYCLDDNDCADPNDCMCFRDEKGSYSGACRPRNRQSGRSGGVCTAHEVATRDPVSGCRDPPANCKGSGCGPTGPAQCNDTNCNASGSTKLPTGGGFYWTCGCE